MDPSKLPALTEVEELKSRLDALRPLNPEVEAKVVQKLRMLWNYHSNALEGNRYTLGETESVIMYGLTAKGKPFKDYLDIEGHNEAVGYVTDLVRGQEVLTEAAIRKMHEILLVKPYSVDAVTPDGKPVRKTVKLGEYKSEPNHVKTRTGEIHYYAPPEEVPRLMGELMEYYRLAKAGEMHPIVAAATFHHRFTHIHPFDDGNGRLSRLLMNLMLMEHGYPSAVLQIDERDSYLTALQSADAGDIASFVNLLARTVSLSLQIYLRAAQGEEIHDLLDVARDIALLKQSLRHIADPVELSSGAQRELFASTIEPLFSRIKGMAADLVDLFRESNVVIAVVSGIPQKTQRASDWTYRLRALDLSPALALVQGGEVILSITATFSFNGFKKAGTEPFDLQRRIGLTFEPLRYVITVSGAPEPHLYGDPMDTDTMNKIASDIVRGIVTDIRSKTKLQL